jgi:hypothetical protein
MPKPKSGPELHQNPLTLQEKINFQLADFSPCKAYATSQTHFIPNQLCLPIIHVQHSQTAHVQYISMQKYAYTEGFVTKKHNYHESLKEIQVCLGGSGHQKTLPS